MIVLCPLSCTGNVSLPVVRNMTQFPIWHVTDPNIGTGNHACTPCPKALEIYTQLQNGQCNQCNNTNKLVLMRKELLKKINFCYEHLTLFLKTNSCVIFSTSEHLPKVHFWVASHELASKGIHYSVKSNEFCFWSTAKGNRYWLKISISDKMENSSHCWILNLTL